MDYAESLVKLTLAIKDYRSAVLKSDLDTALYWSGRIMKYSYELDMWTEKEIKKLNGN